MNRTIQNAMTIVWRVLTTFFVLHYYFLTCVVLEEIKKCKKRVKRLVSQRHAVFPSGHPSKYYPRPMLLNFGDRTRTGVFSMVWTLAII